MNLVEYYWVIYGYTSRMAKARGLIIQETLSNEYFLGFEKYNFIGAHEKLNCNLEDSVISAEDYEKSQESLIVTEKKLIEKSMDAFTSGPYNEYGNKYIVLKGTGEISVTFVIVKNYGHSFITDTYNKLLNDLKKEIGTSKLCIITYQLPLNQLMKKINNPSMTFMTHSDLQYDPSYHKLTPKHILMRDDEKKKYLQQTGVQLSDMVKLPKNDVMVKWIGAAPGQIIKVIQTLDYGSVFDIKYMLVIKEEY